MAEKLDAASCAALLEKQRYNPDILPALEAYVEAQCAGGTYDVDCNLAVLKLYQFHPEKNNVLIVAKILAKALMRLPDTDYLLCSYLIPERVQEVELIANLTAIATQLETCSFRAVWSALQPLREDLLDGIPGFDAAIREFVLETMQITYQAIPEAHLCESLNVGSAEMQQLVASRSWTCEGSVVKVTLNADNIAKPRKLDESGLLRGDQMTKILSSIAS